MQQAVGWAAHLSFIPDDMATGQLDDRLEQHAQLALLHGLKKSFFGSDMFARHGFSVGIGRWFLREFTRYYYALINVE
jgi:hypothetical protein